MKTTLRTSVFASALHQVLAVDEPSKRKRKAENQNIIPSLEELFTHRHIQRTSPSIPVASSGSLPTTNETQPLPLVVSVHNALEWINEAFPPESHSPAERSQALSDKLLPDDEADPVAAFGPPLPKGAKFSVPALTNDELEQRCWQLVSAGRAYNTNEGYKRSFCTWLEHRFARGLHPTISSNWSKAMLTFIMDWTHRVKLSPGYLRTTVSGTISSLLQLGVVLPHVMYTLTVKRALDGYQNTYVQVIGPPKDKYRPTTKTVLQLTLLAKQHMSPDMCEVLIACIYMQAGLSLRPGHIWHPDNDDDPRYPHGIRKIGFVYQSAVRGLYVVPTSGRFKDWEEIPIGMSIETTHKTSKFIPVKLTLPAATTNPDPDDSDRLCFVRPMHALLRKYPPKPGKHFLHNLLDDVRKDLGGALTRLLDEHMKVHGSVNFVPHSLRSASVTQMMAAGHSIDDIMQLGCWKSDETLRKHYGSVSFTGFNSRQRSAIYNTSYDASAANSMPSVPHEPPRRQRLRR